MPSLQEAHRRHSLFYTSFVQSNPDAFDSIDQQFEQLQVAISWLIKQTSPDHAQLLLSLVKAFSPYLQRRGLNIDLLNYCENASEAAKRLDVNIGWLYLLKYEALWALGEWENALVTIQTAITTTSDSDPQIHARAVLNLGRLQLNRGQYREAMQTLTVAEDLLMRVGDYDGVATAKAEVAAYFLNRDEYKKALDLYLEADKLWVQVKPSARNHTLLMLGVVYRRLKNHGKARQLLNELIHQGESQKARGSVATGKHHLAWICFDLHEWKQAKTLAAEAKQIYEELMDPRGISDVEEQLGLISLAEQDFTAAEALLTRSLALRRQLGNQHGVATTLRRFAKLYLVQRRFLVSLKFLWQSLLLYHQLGVLNCRHFCGIMRYLFE